MTNETKLSQGTDRFSRGGVLTRLVPMSARIVRLGAYLPAVLVPRRSCVRATAEVGRGEQTGPDSVTSNGCENGEHRFHMEQTSFRTTALYRLTLRQPGPGLRI